MGVGARPRGAGPMDRRRGSCVPGSVRIALVPLAAAALLLLAAGPAAADGSPRGMLAHFAGVDPGRVVAVAGYTVEGRGHVTHVVVGSYRDREHEQRMIVLLRCGPRACHGKPVWFGPHPVRVLGLVDLEGAPGPLGGGTELRGRADWTGRRGAPGARARWPALIVETREERVTTGPTRFRKEVTGTERHHELVVLSLRTAEAGAPKLASLPTVDLYPSGAGTTTSYELVRGAGKGQRRAPLEIVGLEQRHLDRDLACIRPEPVPVRYVLTGGRYVRTAERGRAGCG